MRSYKDMVEEYVDRTETVAEEITIMTGLTAKVVKGEIHVDTMAGIIKITPSEKTIMGDVYRFINHYGGMIAKWGLENKIKESRI